MYFTALLLHLSYLSNLVRATSYYPPKVRDTKTVDSRQYEGARIEYKQSTICETTPGVKAFSGYVRLPGRLSSNVDKSDFVNHYFWYFEARHDPHTAPLAIYFEGGPGLSSLQGVFTETGPCNVGQDSNGTVLNPWSWNNHVNMLYIDQPLSVGFSYDILVNGTFDSLKDKQPATERGIGSLSEADQAPEPNNTFFVGTFPSQNPNRTANSTLNAATDMWHFLQTWVADFPEYYTSDERISLWGTAFAGQFATLYAHRFWQINDQIQGGCVKQIDELPASPRILNVDTVGLINGWIEMMHQAASYLTFPFNNTYGVEIASESVQEQITDAFERPGGCVDRTQSCQQAALESDPENRAHNATVNELCFKSAFECTMKVRGPIAATQYNTFDLGHWNPDPYPPSYYIGFLNQRWVQEDLGVPLNFTAHSALVTTNFLRSGAFALPWARHALGRLLDRGVQVTMMYGDRDMDVSWAAGEQVSVDIEHAASAEFAASGYEDLMVDANRRGGVTRQHGRLSFSRVFEAANRVPAYQPEAAYQIFQRAVSGLDIATGRKTVDEQYGTRGARSAWHGRTGMPRVPQPECYIWDVATCTSAHRQALANGSAVVRDGIVVDW